RIISSLKSNDKTLWKFHYNNANILLIINYFFNKLMDNILSFDFIKSNELQSNLSLNEKFDIIYNNIVKINGVTVHINEYNSSKNFTIVDSKKPFIMFKSLNDTLNNIIAIDGLIHFFEHFIIQLYYMNHGVNMAATTSGVSLTIYTRTADILIDLFYDENN